MSINKPTKLTIFCISQEIGLGGIFVGFAFPTFTASITCNSVLITKGFLGERRVTARAFKSDFYVLHRLSNPKVNKLPMCKEQ